MKPEYKSASSFRQTETCSDCIERDDVDLLGRPRFERRARVQDCEGCGGSGRQRSNRVDIVAWFVSTQERTS